MANELVKLAERCEAATGDEQRELLREAFDLAFPGEGPNTNRRGRFDTMLACKAYESAAMTLVPEGWEFVRLERRRSWPDDPRGDRQLLEAEMMEPHGSGYSKTSAPTAALALTAAALRAHQDRG